MQVEYATDMVFPRQEDLAPLYEEIVRTAIHAVQAGDIATFLGRKRHGNYRDAVGNDFHTRIEGTRIKHHIDKVAIKMYDKFHLILRVETTANGVSFFKHYRTVIRRDGRREEKFVVMKKHLYSLDPLRETLLACNRRDLDFLAAIDGNVTALV